MHPLEVYYLHKAVRGLTQSGWIGPVYAAPLFLQWEHGTGNFFFSLLRWVRLILWRGAKAVGCETSLSGGNILTDIAWKRSLELST